MSLPRECRLLRIHLGESDVVHGKPLFEVLVLKARELNLAGATVLRGPLGYGRSSRLHTTKILRLSSDLPVVVEIVEAEERIRLFLAEVESILPKDGILITWERVEVLRDGAG